MAATSTLRRSDGRRTSSIPMLFDAFHDPRTWTLDKRPLNLLPDHTHSRDEALGSVAGVEIEIDKYVVRIAQRAIHAISAHAGSLTPCRVSIERGAPASVVADWVLDLNSHHGRTFACRYPTSCDRAMRVAI